jgi:type II secretory pathway pseudopilin PulG
MRNIKGIVLIENLLALAIAALVITSLVQFFILSSMYVKVANHRVASLNFIQDRIEELRSFGYSGIVVSDYSPPVEEPILLDAMDPSTAADDIYAIRRTSVTSISGGKKIVVEMEWAEFDRALSETAQTVLFELE